jgi:outer membrane biosynthesis protein TonB
MEATLMKVLGVISTAAMFLLLGTTVPAFAQEEHQEEGAKPAQHEEEAKPAPKQEQTKPQKQEEQAKPAKQEAAKPQKQEEQAKPAKQEEAKPQKQEQQQQAKTQQPKPQQTEEKNQHPQQAKAQPQQSQGQFARNGQKDSSGHVYNESHFGPTHHARFEATGGREYNGRREYSYGGYWFYAGSYPAWFYQQDVYFIMGADGLWYAVAYGNPSLMFQVNIG